MTSTAPSLCRRLAVSALCATFALGAASCEVLGDTSEILSFSIPITYTLPVTVPVAYPGSDRISELQNNNERSITIISYVPIDLGDIDDRITGSNVVEEVRVEGVTMEVVENTLEDVDIQPFEIRVGEPGTQFLGQEVGGAAWDDAAVIAVTPVVQAATPPFTGEVQADIVSENQSAAAQRIANVDFGLGMGTELLIPQGDFPSGGRADVRFTLQLAIVVNPL